jgi:hypothetical protein
MPRCALRAADTTPSVVTIRSVASYGVSPMASAYSTTHPNSFASGAPLSVTMPEVRGPRSQLMRGTRYDHHEWYDCGNIATASRSSRL